MALLASSWLLVESFVVPHGFLKWFYLSFYIHPFFLVFCQVFLWLKELKNLLICLFYPLTAFSLFIFGFMQRAVFAFFSKNDLFYDAFEPNIFLEETQTVVLSKFVATFEETKTHEICVKESWLNEFLNSSYCYTSSYCIASFHFDSMDESVVENKSSHEGTQDSVISSSDPLLLEDMIPFSCSGSNDKDSLSEEAGVPAVVDDQGDVEDTDDQFHHKYTSRVRFFDVLYRERLQGINAISNELLSSPDSAWSTREAKRVMRSLECDVEMISVAQCWLFWEALDHQYHKVESYISLECDDNNNGNGKIVLFHHHISGKFQELEILLERFVEDQKSECQLLSSSSSKSNASKRLSFQALLHVPDVTGFLIMKGENKQMMKEEYCIGSTKLLQVIQKCVNAFWLYIKTDDQNKPFWKYKAIFTTTHPPVEDPRDLKLLYDVVKILHKKGIMLRNEEGKSKCWMRRKVRPVEAEHEKRNLLVAMIDMKLVQRMLKMSSISRSHLQWCQEKLDNIEFKQGGVFRGRITRIFPLP